MTDLDKQAQDLKDRIAAAVRNRARAEHEHDAAHAQAEQIRERLQREFAVVTVADAKRLLAEFQTNYADSITRLRAALDQLEA